MDNADQYDELLVKYLTGDMNTEEKAFVENWINSNEHNSTYFEELKSIWHLTVVKNTVSDVNVEHEWNHFMQAVQSTDGKILPLHKQENNREYEEEPDLRRKSFVYRMLVPVAVAASVLLVVGFGWQFLASNKNKQETIVANSGKKTDSILLAVHREINTTNKERPVKLADGSLVLLSPKSEITYRQPFTTARDIALIGRAYFNVAKDKTKPFTVISGDISTTALGTKFSVTAYRSTNHIIVRLYEGKVVVKPLKKGNKRMLENVYLLPGQELIYGGPKAIVRTFRLNTDQVADETTNDEVARDTPAIPESYKASYFMFNNQSLTQVLDNLAALYNVKIVYNKKELRKIYFTGKYNRSDSLEPILQRIATLNNLTIIKKGDAFILSR